MARGAALVRPEFELVIRDAEGAEMLVAAIFIEEAGKVDIGLGWDGDTDIHGIRAILESVQVALSGTIAWHDRHDLLDTNKGKQNEGDSVPF